MKKQIPEEYRRTTPVDEVGENLRIVGDALHMMSEELAKTNEELGKLQWSYNNIIQRLDYMDKPLHRKLIEWFRTKLDNNLEDDEWVD